MSILTYPFATVGGVVQTGTAIVARGGLAAVARGGTHAARLYSSRPLAENVAGDGAPTVVARGTHSAARGGFGGGRSQGTRRPSSATEARAQLATNAYIASVRDNVRAVEIDPDVSFMLLSSRTISRSAFRWLAPRPPSRRLLPQSWRAMYVFGRGVLARLLTLMSKGKEALDVFMAKFAQFVDGQVGFSHGPETSSSHILTADSAHVAWHRQQVPEGRRTLRASSHRLCHGRQGRVGPRQQDIRRDQPRSLHDAHLAHRGLRLVGRLDGLVGGSDGGDGQEGCLTKKALFARVRHLYYVAGMEKKNRQSVDVSLSRAPLAVLTKRPVE
jgi:hypothetical protein